MLFSILVAFNLVESTSLGMHRIARNVEEDICDPHLLQYSQYPGILTKIDVVGTKPLKTRVHFRLINSTKEVSFEGIVFGGDSLTNEARLTACRSLGCSKVAAYHTIAWTRTQSCMFTCPDGTSALQTCRYMLNYLKCPTDAMSLMECTGGSWSVYQNYDPQTYGSELICTECGEN